MELRTNNYSPSFGSVYLIQISKRAIAETSPATVERIFKNEVNKLTASSGKNNMLKLILYKLGFKKAKKTTIFLEQPSYVANKEILAKDNRSSLRWMALNTNTNIPDELDPNFYSFTVLTKEHQKEALSLLSLKNIIKFSKQTATETQEFIKKFKYIPSQIWQTAKRGAFLDECINSITSGEKVNKFRIGSLDELPEVVKNIDYK